MSGIRDEQLLPLLSANMESKEPPSAFDAYRPSSSDVDISNSSLTQFVKGCIQHCVFVVSLLMYPFYASFILDFSRYWNYEPKFFEERWYVLMPLLVHPAMLLAAFWRSHRYTTIFGMATVFAHVMGCACMYLNGAWIVDYFGYTCVGLMGFFVAVLFGLMACDRPRLWSPKGLSSR